MEYPNADGYHRGVTVWLTGFSGAGKSTIARAVYTDLRMRGMRSEILDADELRQHLGRDLGFTKEDRDENVRRIGYIAGLLTRHGVIALVAAISPYRALRDEIRSKIERFIEVHVDAPLSVCEARDPKGLYRKARAGDLLCFTGIDDPYEKPLAPEVHLRTDVESVHECVVRVAAQVIRLIEAAAPETRE